MFRSLMVVCLILVVMVTLSRAVSVVEASQPVLAAVASGMANATNNDEAGPFPTRAVAQAVADYYNWLYSDSTGSYAHVEERADGFWVVVEGLFPE